MTGVYLIENKINNKKYIGCSKDIEKRWKEHIYLYDKTSKETYSKKALYQAFKKYGIENFSFSVLEETNDYFEREKYWIEFYNSFGHNGYNMTKGGEGRVGTSELLRDENNPNAKLTNEEVYFLRSCVLQDFIQEDIYNDYFIDKISFRQFQRIWQGEGWEDINPEAIEYVKSKEYISKIRSKASLSREIVKNNIERKKILLSLQEKNYSRMDAYQYYIDNYEQNYSLSAFSHLWYDIKPKKEKRYIYKIDKDTGEVLSKYNSFADAARENNCDSSGISKVCKGIRTNCGGYKWEQK